MVQQHDHNYENLPPLNRDRSFWAMTVTQFLGAFNDNLFKQIVLLLCVDLALKDPTQNRQGIAIIIFSAPFILFSGFGGFLSDRYRKRTIIVLCKVAEIVVMLLGAVAFLSNSLNALLVVMFLMGTQSAFFGPAKYGILPETVRGSDLPRANGIILMTTFLAIIFGFTAAGELKELLGDRLWIASVTCVAIAAIGTLTSLWIRQTPIAQPGIQFQISAIAVNPDTRRLLQADPQLLIVLLVLSLFWFVGGVIYPPAINDLGKLQLDLGDAKTGRLAACTGIGIAVGCMLAGRLSRHRINAHIIRIGFWGLIFTLSLLAISGPMKGQTLLGIYGAGAALIAVGIFAGLFTVPLQAFLQFQAPEEQKGRIIGTMNLFNWIGIALSGVFYHFMNGLFARFHLPPHMMFAAAAYLLVPLAIFYRPKDVTLS